jgi:hypothetical protein
MSIELINKKPTISDYVGWCNYSCFGFFLTFNGSFSDYGKQTSSLPDSVKSMFGGVSKRYVRY